MDPLSIGLALSIHAGFTDADFNKYHPYIEYETQSQYAVGLTYNSENNISFYAKKARGMMARYIIDNQVSSLEQLTQFDRAGYYFVEQESSATELVFKREEQ